jgi:hypothetical protein
MTEQYIQGFIEKCGEAGIDPEDLVKVAARGDQLMKAITKLTKLNPNHSLPGQGGYYMERLVNSQPAYKVHGDLFDNLLHGSQNKQSPVVADILKYVNSPARRQVNKLPAVNLADESSILANSVRRGIRKETARKGLLNNLGYPPNASGDMRRGGLMNKLKNYFN